MTIAKLAGSIYGNVLTINDMLEHFERSVKPNFKDSSERSYIKFGGRRDTDQRLGIRSGQLMLDGYVKFHLCMNYHLNSLSGMS